MSSPFLFMLLLSVWFFLSLSLFSTSIHEVVLATSVLVCCQRLSCRQSLAMLPPSLLHSFWYWSGSESGNLPSCCCVGSWSSSHSSPFVAFYFPSILLSIPFQSRALISVFHALISVFHALISVFHSSSHYSYAVLLLYCSSFHHVHVHSALISNISIVPRDLYCYSLISQPFLSLMTPFLNHCLLIPLCVLLLCVTSVSLV